MTFSKRGISRNRILTLVLTAILAGCSDSSDATTDPGPAGGPPPVSSVVLTPRTAELEVGSTRQFAATIFDSTGTVLDDRSVSWASTNADVASIDSDGLATALKPGVTIITATSEGVSDSASLTVIPVPAASVVVTPSDALLEVGQSVSLTAETRDADGIVLTDRAASWSSSDPAVATVSADGDVEAVAVGTASIEAVVEEVSGVAGIIVVHASVTLVGAGDIADCDSPWDEQTALLLDGIPGTVFTLGDNVYEDGTPQEYANCYDPTWGRHKDRTSPSIGNHEYHADNGAPHFAYFGDRAGDPDKGYYAYEAGAWKVIVLNSNPSKVAVDAGSAQEQWLRTELAASDHTCTLAYWHHPRFSSGAHGSDDRFDAFWQALYEYGADLVLVGHDHHYERLALLNPAGELDPSSGIRQIIAGTGGRSLRPTGVPVTGSEVRDSDTHGVLKLTLRHDSYEWEFIPVAGKTFTDFGSDVCH